MNVSENPKRTYSITAFKQAIDILLGQLLYGELKNLDISDVVTFAGELVQEDIPKIPDGLLKFEELKLYICPFGVVLGATVYPAGFSFKADLLFFQKRANIDCSTYIHIFEQHLGSEIERCDSDRQGSELS